MKRLFNWTIVIAIISLISMVLSVFKQWEIMANISGSAVIISVLVLVVITTKANDEGETLN